MVTSLHEDLFRLLVESVKDYAIFALDTSGRIVSWNEGARRIKGYAAQEIIGRHFSIFYPASDIRQGKPDYGLRVALDEGRWSDEGWRVRKDGSRFWASVVITALYDDGGTHVGFAKVTRDLSERKQVEDERVRLLELEHNARMQSETTIERLRIIQSVTEVALSHLTLDDLLAALLDRIQEILHVDTVAVLLRDYDSDDLVARAAKGIEEEVEQGVRIPVGKGFAGRIAAQRTPVVLDEVDHTKVMNPILLQKGIKSLLGVPLLLEGTVLGVLHVGSLHRREFTDHDVQLLQIVADRVSLALEHARMVEMVHTSKNEVEVAEAMVQARDAFLSVAAHELRTPLTSLRLAAQTLLRQSENGRTLDPKTLAQTSSIIARQTDRVSRLSTQLLETVRDQEGKLELDRRRVDLRELIQDALDGLEPHAAHHQLVTDMQEDVWAEVDPLRLEQVVTNLVDNAIKFSPDGSTVAVELDAPAGGWVRFCVRDWGIGVPPEYREHLFERFYQAHRLDHRSGLGLGLYISRQIVELHGGRIHAEFPAPSGTRMVVELPENAPVPDREGIAEGAGP